MASSSSSAAAAERPILFWTTLKVVLSIGFITLTYYNHEILSLIVPLQRSQSSTTHMDATTHSTIENVIHHRRLLQVDHPNERQQSSSPSYMKALMNDLQKRYDLFTNTPPEEIKYWFEYSGPLQVRYGKLVVMLCT
jgi:hypothetical protein